MKHIKKFENKNKLPKFKVGDYVIGIKSDFSFNLTVFFLDNIVLLFILFLM